MLRNVIGVGVAIILLAGCGKPATPTHRAASNESPPVIGGTPTELTGLHNIIRVSEKLYSGSSPDGDAGFTSLKKLGIQTILSVDGARPEVERAKRSGMRYVHLPIGYDSVSQDQALKLTKAVRDLPGPIYLHCHHGKHRSPAAAAAIQFCLDDTCSPTKAIDIMKRAGTDPRYVGLYAAPHTLRRPTANELDETKVEFRESVDLPPLAKTMVQIDMHWDHLGLIKKAGWTVPKNHPDLDPAHEALQLWEHYRELSRSPDTQKRPADFAAWLKDSEQAAQELEWALRQKADATAINKSYNRLRLACTPCHLKYRDVPQK